MGRATCAALLLCLAAIPAMAQESDNTLALDVSWLGGDLSYARATGEASSLGFSVGAAGWWMASEHFGGGHFDDGDLLGLARGGGFWRRDFSEHAVVDVGIQIGAVIHGGDEGNAAMALFGGPYVAPMFGWRTVKFGPRLHIVWVWEGGDTNEIGVVIDPLTARVQLDF